MGTRVAQPRWCANTMNLEFPLHCRFTITWLLTSRTHLVFETERHAAVFDDVAGSSLIEDFQIAQMRVLPDHCHLRVRLLPAMSVSERVLLLMNNSWAMMNRRFWVCAIRSASYWFLIVGGSIRIHL